jgi:hypothetical protein
MKNSTHTVAALLVSLLSSGCMSLTLYTVDPVPPERANLTRDETAASLTQGGVTVTVGQLRNGSDPNFGILISNNSASEVEIQSNGASLLANGNPVKLMTHAEIRDLAGSIKRGQAIAAGLFAASGSLAQSSAQRTENMRAIDERRQRRIVDTPTSPIAASVRPQVSAKETARLAARNNSILWSDTHELRDVMAQSHEAATEYYWRSERIAPGQWVLRTIWANTTLGNILNSQNGQLEVKLTVAGQPYAYRFDAVTRSTSEHLNERGKRTARAREAAKEQ